MDISSLCQRDIVSVGANATIREAAEAMRRDHVGALVVTDPEVPGRAIGVVTDRDLVVDLLAQGLPVEGQMVGTLCSTTLIGVPSSATLQEAVQEMRRAGVRRLLVVRPGGSLAGLVSADDLFEAIAGELLALAGALRGGIAQETLRTTPDRPHFDTPEKIYLPGHGPCRRSAARRAGPSGTSMAISQPARDGRGHGTIRGTVGVRSLTDINVRPVTRGILAFRIGET